ncbi:hypothetical protein [Neobacillus jeddahensis]|uniref:hypothetical protein n=1 Tax=Neobacillus jeddahensis TaxID=1461580 RepID=UPI00058D45F4|nr:hypothetical protein [Neobacillus jeddahensis]
MVTTQLPTKTDYEKAMDELKKLNEDLFYDDFKEKIKQLENNLLQLVMNSSSDFKKETEHVVSQANLLFRQMETQKQETRELLETNQSETLQRNQDFLEEERTRFLSVYDELQKSIQFFTEKTAEFQESIESNNKSLLDKTVTAITSVTGHVTEFTEKLAISDDRNRQFLEQNEAFVKLSKEQLALTEKKVSAHMATLQKMDEHLKLLHKSYEEMFHKHSEAIKSIMVVREEAFMDKLTHQLEYWSTKQAEQDEERKRDLQQWHEQVDSAISARHKQSHEMLESFSNKMLNKEDLAKVEKKNTLRMNILLSVVVVEAILIGIKFFM